MVAVLKPENPEVLHSILKSNGLKQIFGKPNDARVPENAEQWSRTTEHAVWTVYVVPANRDWTAHGQQDFLMGCLKSDGSDPYWPSPAPSRPKTFIGGGGSGGANDHAGLVWIDIQPLPSA